MTRIFWIVIFTASCGRTSSTTEAVTMQSASASASATPSAVVWHPHRLAKLDADTFCAELVEGNIAERCVPSVPGETGNVAVFGIPGRQRTEANGVVVSFGKDGSLEQWIAESLAGDAGVAPVYHYSTSAKMVVTFNGDVPEQTKLRVVEALDTL